MARKRNYVNNPDLIEALVEYKKACKEAEDSGEELPLVPEYIGTCIYEIANRLARRPNFSGYTYRDEMVSDGIENGLRALQNFDPEKSQNPFGYFTQIIWFAFLRRIDKEHKQTYIKHRVASNHLISGTAVEGGEDISTGITDFLGIDRESTTEFIKNYENKMNKKGKKKDE